MYFLWNVFTIQQLRVITRVKMRDGISEDVSFCVCQICSEYDVYVEYIAANEYIVD